MATPRKPKGSEEPDWVVIRGDYEKGGISYRKLAAKWGVSFNTLKDRAVSEGWAKSRAEIHHRITTETQQRIVDQKSSLIDDLMTDQIGDLKKLWGMATEQARKLIEEETTKQIPTAFGIEDINFNALDRLAGLKMAGVALKDYQFAMRRALGLEGKQNQAADTSDEPMQRLASALDGSAVPDLAVEPDEMPEGSNGV